MTEYIPGKFLKEYLNEKETLPEDEALIIFK